MQQDTVRYTRSQLVAVSVPSTTTTAQTTITRLSAGNSRRQLGGAGYKSWRLSILVTNLGNGSCVAAAAAADLVQSAGMHRSSILLRCVHSDDNDDTAT